MIDGYWRKFLNGEIVDFLRALIQEAIASFFEFAIKEGIYLSEPRDNNSYQIAEDTNDLSRIQKIYSQEFAFSLEGKEFNATLITCSRELKKVIGYQAYERRKDIGERVVDTMEIYNKFFSSARELGFKRNIDSHNKKEILDSGHALSVAANVLNIIELNPNLIRNQDRLTAVKKNLGLLLKAIIEKEDPELTIYQDKEENENDSPKAARKIIKESVLGLQTSIDDIDHKLSSHIENFEEQVEEIVYRQTVLEATSDPEIAELKKIINESAENIDEILNVQKKEIDDEFDIESKLDLNEITNVLDQSNGIISFEEADEISTDENFLTPQLALGEMLEMQRRFKKRFRCENWENIAQGPFREIVIENQIKSKKEFFENKFILERYEKNKSEMDKLIDSDLGTQFFSILPKILFQ